MNADAHDGSQRFWEVKSERVKRAVIMGDSGLQELAWLAGIATCMKLLLVPSYHSTDFEVHRHWLATTRSLPLKFWYTDKSSEWTLDYPPFFAFFERFLAVFASLFDPRIVDLNDGQNYASDSVVLFQRLTVIAADGVLYWGLWESAKGLSIRKRRLVYLTVIFSPGLLIVDHIHFQYNGFLFGMLLLSLASLRDGNDLLGGVLFAILVCFKHLFAVAGPLYFVYLLRHYCKGPQKVLRFFTLAGSVTAILAVAFGPFAYYGQISQILKRLFPFGRGLCHAYWAPNIWALYNAADKIAAHLLRRLGLAIQVPKAAMTGGLVGDFTPYALLPQITPKVSALLVLGSMMPCLVQAWRRPRQTDIIRWVAYTYACGYMFGWHVHEKASLHFVIPFSIVAVETLDDASKFLFLSIVSTYSLFPLLFEAKEYPIKVTLLLLYTLVVWISFVEGTNEKESNDPQKKRTTMNAQKSSAAATKVQQPRETLKLLGRWEQAYLGGLVMIEVYNQCMHPLIFKASLPFVPLMLISIYCALGMLYFWGGQLFRIMCRS